ncbi:MAG: penicillin-binding transpeptidase domain-containing protein, partial [Verrucomicrobiota bacterium]
ITRHLELEREQGLTNACALLVDHTSMEVLAYVGSANFWDTTIHGQVDGVTMRRSPGSTLKPFIYALAMEQGLIHPYSLLKDTRLRYGDGYAPENFDRAYQGPLSAKEALQRSRNVPAVSLANDLRQPTLYQFLQRASVTLPHSAEHYGLSLALGGAEVSLEELVRLYAMLPNQGAIQSLRFQPHEFPRPRQILAPEATFLTLTMMENIPAPGASRLLGRSAEAPVYWKTGTSHGFRDAWAIAVFDHYVLGVWIGDFPGGSRANYVAREATAPLLFDMIGALRDHGDASESFRAQPHGSRLRKVDLCSLTGQKPSPHCPSSRKGWFIPGVSPITRCDVHQVLLIDTASGLRLRPDQATPERACHWETFECWPSDLLTLYRQAGLPRRTPPPYLSPRQEPTALTRSPSFAGGRGGTLRILSPRPGTPYTLEPGRSAIPLQALAPADCQEVYWFANRSFLGSAPPTEPFLWEDAPLGQHQLRAVDDEGRVSETTLLVKAAPRSSP